MSDANYKLYVQFHEVGVKEIVEKLPLDKALDTVNVDIAAFNDFFVSELHNEPLTMPEKAIIKTYLGWKLHKGNNDISV